MDILLYKLKYEVKERCGLLTYTLYTTSDWKDLLGANGLPASN